MIVFFLCQAKEHLLRLEGSFINPTDMASEGYSMIVEKVPDWIPLRNCILVPPHLGVHRVVKVSRKGVSKIIRTHVQARLDSHTVQMSRTFRDIFKIDFEENRSVLVEPMAEPSTFDEVVLLSDCTNKFGISIKPTQDEIEDVFRATCNDTILERGSVIVLTVQKHRCQVTVVEAPAPFGRFATQTEIDWVGNSEADAGSIMNINRISYETLGVGGMESQFEELFRRVFMTRAIKKRTFEKLGIQHVKGVLLYGVPGCGKTLLARNIGKILKCEEPIVVNGPEILDKFVGESENKLRKLFEPAEKNPDKLFMIIFDEFDAICRTRSGDGGSGSRVNDSLVNQLLAKIDGVKALHNIILVGMTNRPELIDEAVKRPGRFEVHIEVGLPDEVGRKQIFSIHTATMKATHVMDEKINLEYLAEITQNYTGAEIESVVKTATTSALRQLIDTNQIHETCSRVDSVTVTMDDFIAATNIVRPMYGRRTAALSKFLVHAPSQLIFDEVVSEVGDFMADKTKNLFSVLFHGQCRSGKTTLAAHVVQAIKTDSCHYLGAADLLECAEGEKPSKLIKRFHDAIKTPTAILVIDDVDIIVDWTPPHSFSNKMMQTIKTLLGMSIDTKLLIILCTNHFESLNDRCLFDRVSRRFCLGHGNSILV